MRNFTFWGGKNYKSSQKLWKSCQEVVTSMHEGCGYIHANIIYFYSSLSDMPTFATAFLKILVCKVWGYLSMLCLHSYCFVHGFQANQ
jgi:hypothetical protein